MSLTTEPLIVLLVGLLAVAAAAWVGFKLSARFAAQEQEAALERVRAQAQTELGVLHERLRGLQDEAQRHSVELQSAQQRQDALRAELDSIRDERSQLSERAARVPELEKQGQQLQALLDASNKERSLILSRNTELITRLQAESQQAEEKLGLLQNAREALSLQFKNLANEIFEEKGQRFAAQNQMSLETLLQPLRTRLTEFQGKVEQFYDTEGKERSALAQQVLQLMQLNKNLSDDAKNLTRALSGSVKSQGNWGELILSRVLEASGLRKGEEYVVQESHARDDGSRAQPDVVVRLPEGRHLIVDAKVSLVAYDQWANADTEEQRNLALRRHLDSVRAHIKGLSERNYQDLYGVKSLDFVLLFVPIEPAFMLAVQSDSQMFMEAWERNVLLVSPSTLLFVVRTVAHLWRQEQQNRNAQDIAKRGAELYDKLHGFVSDMEKVGDRLNQAQASFGDAFGKLSRQRGNVIRQAEMLRDLGVKPSKSFSSNLLESSTDEAAAISSGEPPLTSG